MKICTTCKLEKPMTAFKLSPTGKDGYMVRCKECVLQQARDKYAATHAPHVLKTEEEKRATRRAHYARTQDRRNEVARAWGLTKKGKYNNYRDNAKRRDLPFNITLEEFKTFWQVPCTYCGDEIETVGIDRVDSSIGYEKENLVPCCKVCNAMKTSLLLDTFNKHIAKIYLKLGGR